MNKFGQFEIKPIAVVLALIGAVIAFFTISGGFSSWDAGLEPSLIMKLIVTVVGGAAGFIWGSMMGD